MFKGLADKSTKEKNAKEKKKKKNKRVIGKTTKNVRNRRCAYNKISRFRIDSSGNYRREIQRDASSIDFISVRSSPPFSSPPF